MLDELVSAYGNRFLIAAAGVSLALLGLFIVLWILRHKAPSPFVRGGRNRQPRLQVLDAAAVDARRRIVLVRRDNIEHLIMIGGPTDIVIESGIGDERPYISVQPPRQDLLADSEPQATQQPSPPQQVTQVHKLPPASHPVESSPPAPREEVATRAERPAPQAAPATPPRHQPAVAVAAQPAQPPLGQQMQPRQPAQPQQSAGATPEVETAALKTGPDVEDVFEEARKRVIPRETVAEPAREAIEPSLAPAAPPRPEVIEPAKAAQPGSSDFEKLLEAEMSTHLDLVKAANQQTAPRPVPTVLPPSPPSVPPSIVAAPAAPRPAPPASAAAPLARQAVAQPQTPAVRPAAPGREEPNLQTEIARIFGEMGSGRNE